MATSLSCYDKRLPYNHSYTKVEKEKKIGVVRTDNHGLIFSYCLGPADRYHFLKASGQLYILEHKWEPVIPLRDTLITGCYGHLIEDREHWDPKDLEAADKMVETLAWQPEAFAKAFNCPIYDTLEEMADPELFDGIFVGNCHWYGQDHIAMCMPFIKKGIPIFVDKPFAANAKDAATLLKAAREYNCPIFCTSILYYDEMFHNLVDQKLGKAHLVVASSSTRIEERNGSVHNLAAMLGGYRFSNGNDYKIDSITYLGSDKSEPNKEVYKVAFADGTIGILNMGGVIPGGFRVDAFCEKGPFSEYAVEQSFRGGIVEICHEFSKMIDTRIPPVEYDRIFEFVAVLDAGIRAKTEGRTVTIDEIAEEAGWTFGISDRA